MNTILEPLIDQNKSVYRRFVQEVFNEGRLDRLEEFLSPAYIAHDAAPGLPEGPVGIRQIVTLFRGAFPDLKVSIEELVAEGDKVCARITTGGTHQGLIFGVPGTGKSVAMPGLAMVRVVDGQLVEGWVKNDVIGLLRQLGATPPTLTAQRAIPTPERG